MSNLDIVPREESERRLAAILVADVVGYSRLMQAEGTLARLEEIGANIVDPRVAAHRGRRGGVRGVATALAAGRPA